MFPERVIESGKHEVWTKSRGSRAKDKIIFVHPILYQVMAAMTLRCKFLTIFSRPSLPPGPGEGGSSRLVQIPRFCRNFLQLP